MTTDTTNERPTLTAARELADAFVTFKRDGSDETIYKCKDGTAQWITDAVMAAHGDMMPDDWKYEHCSHVADAIVETLEYNDADLDRLEVGEIADDLVDIYTASLTAWLASHLDRVGYVDDADHAEEADLGDLLRAGQYAELSEIADALAEAIRERAEELEGEDDDA